MRPTSAVLPRKFQFWPDDASEVSPAKVVQLYEAGFAGAYIDDVGAGEFETFINRQSFGNLDGGAIAHANGLAGTGAGKLILPYLFAEKRLPGVFPGAAQERGDCVSHSTKNGVLITFICDIESGLADEETGAVEGLPEIPAAGIVEGALSPELYYWYRGYDDDGWQCEKGAQVACESAGLWVRKPYPELGFDLTKYSGKLAGKYGSKAPPSKVTETGRLHLVRTATNVKIGEESRDFLNNGYGISTCGGESFSATRDKNGVSKRTSKGWSHAMALIGWDDRDLIKQAYGEPLGLVLNSWGVWNSGPREILGTDLLIPEGSFWAKQSDIVKRRSIALSGVNGWPTKKLPPFHSIVG